MLDRQQLRDDRRVDVAVANASAFLRILVRCFEENAYIEIIQLQHIRSFDNQPFELCKIERLRHEPVAGIVHQRCDNVARTRAKRRDVRRDQRQVHFVHADVVETLDSMFVICPWRQKKVVVLIEHQRSHPSVVARASKFVSRHRLAAPRFTGHTNHAALCGIRSPANIEQ